MERRLAAIALIAAGIWVQWGPGFGLIAAGIGVAVSGVELRPREAAARVWAPVARRGARARTVVVAMPRRGAAVILMAVGILALAVAGAAFLGPGGAAAAIGVGGIGTGAALGHE